MRLDAIPSETSNVLWNFPAFPSHTQEAHPGPVASGLCVPGGLFAASVASGQGCLSANTPSIADMKGCQKCDGWVASWGLASAATSRVRGEIGSERVKYRGPLWPDNYPDWIHLADRSEYTLPPRRLCWPRLETYSNCIEAPTFWKGNGKIYFSILPADPKEHSSVLTNPSSQTTLRLVWLAESWNATFLMSYFTGPEGDQWQTTKTTHGWHVAL